MRFLAFFLALFFCLFTLVTDSQARRGKSRAQQHEPEYVEEVSSFHVGQKFHGVSAWYGQRLHGNRTSDGGRFDMNKMTAAHRTLPFGTRVRVTNERNGKSVVLTITDRGPSSRRYIIDISRGAAERIGMRRAGIAPVTVEILELPGRGKGKRR